MARLSSVTFRIPESKREDLKCFYTKVLGMNHFFSLESEENIDLFVIPQHHPKFSACLQKHDSIDLRFQYKPSLSSYESTREDIYWKIGLALNDVDAAVDTINKGIQCHSKQISQKNPIQRGSQFFEIGFLTHMKDPCDFSIELLQTTFEKNAELRKKLIQDIIKGEDEIISKLKVQQSFDNNDDKLHEDLSLLSSQPFVVGQITTRITDPEKSLDFYTNVLKMKLLSIQEVTEYRFTLYFLGYTEDDPPKKEDLKDVKNREWLWQRKYTTLELQWRWDAKSVHLGKDESAGLESMEIEVQGMEKQDYSGLLQTIKTNSSFSSSTSERIITSSDGYSTQLHGLITDPDGLKIKLISKSSERKLCEA